MQIFYHVFCHILSHILPSLIYCVLFYLFRLQCMRLSQIFAKCDVIWGQAECSLSNLVYFCCLTELLCFCRWQLAQRMEWDGEHRLCLVPAASARAGSLLSGVLTLPQRKKLKRILVSIRSVKFYSHLQVSKLLTVLLKPNTDFLFPQALILHSFCLWYNHLTFIMSH